MNEQQAHYPSAQHVVEPVKKGAGVSLCVSVYIYAQQHMQCCEVKTVYRREWELSQNYLMRLQRTLVCRLTTPWLTVSGGKRNACLPVPWFLQDSLEVFLPSSCWTVGVYSSNCAIQTLLFHWNQWISGKLLKSSDICLCLLCALLNPVLYLGPQRHKHYAKVFIPIMTIVRMHQAFIENRSTDIHRVVNVPWKNTEKKVILP